MTRKQNEQICYVYKKIQQKLKDKTGIELKKYIQYLCENTDNVMLAYLYEKIHDLLPENLQSFIEEKLYNFIMPSTFQSNNNLDQKAVEQVGQILYRINSQQENDF